VLGTAPILPQLLGSCSSCEVFGGGVADKTAVPCAPDIAAAPLIGPSVNCLRGSASSCCIPLRLAYQSEVSIGSSPAALLGDDGEYCPLCCAAGGGLCPGLPPSRLLSIPESHKSKLDRFISSLNEGLIRLIISIL
jgi:hypothetical protein